MTNLYSLRFGRNKEIVRWNGISVVQSIMTVVVVVVVGVF